jgi:DNA polymerase-3 subunit delta'
MGFQDFHGNKETVSRAREMLAARRFPHAVLLVGPPGAGKYTLAQMLAKTLNCLLPPPGTADFCGRCANCLRIAQADDLEARVAEMVEARDSLRETDRKETRIFVQTHPDVLIVPPDPPQRMIKVGQVRRVIEGIYFRPAEGRERVYIFPSSAFMKEAANALLKVLEEPPEYATLFLLAENPGELLPTIRSRCVTFLLSPLSTLEIEEHLAKRRPQWGTKQRGLAARLAEGDVGRALSFDLASYTRAREDALAILRSAAAGDDHTPLFRVTEAYRGGEGKQKTEQLLRTLYSLLEDLLFLRSSAPQLVRNTDALAELTALATRVDFDWIASAAQGLGEVERGMRRNLLQSLSLDSFAVSLEPAK